MVSKSYSNLLELASGESQSLGRIGRRIPRVVTTPGIVPDLDESDDAASNSSSELASPSPRDRTIIVANQLPIRAARQPEAGGWSFTWDQDSLLHQVKDSIGDHKDMEFIYIGSLREEIPLSEQDEVAKILLETFNCVPAFLPADLLSRFYHGFCKQQLWPLFHYMLPLSPDLGGRFERSLWQAYVSVNKIFADKILEVINPDDDFVWIHDYHLMVLPTFLRKRFNRVKLGFFLHSPFPSSEIYRTLPVREELLRSLLHSDLIGFHTFDYARHFLSCCSRMLGLTYESKRGYIGLEYYGRTVSIKILPVGIHMGQLGSVLSLPETEVKVAELMKQFNDRDRIMLLGVDDMDIFKGISLKLLAFEQLLRQHEEWRGRVVLVQIANPARGRGKDVKEVQIESNAMVKRINEAFGRPGYRPVILIDKPLQFYERMAYYVVAECCLVTAVRDGMNLIPYEYVIARQGNENLNKVLHLSSSTPKNSMLVVSEFIGCSPSLSGAIRVNPWNIDAVADSMVSALEMAEAEKQLRHEKHHRYVSTHDVGYWANSFLQDLQRSCRDHNRRRCWGIGFGLGFRVVALDPNFRKLAMEHIVSAYRRTRTRAILLDYDGTLMPQASIKKSPCLKSIEILNTLCRDKNNTVFLVSARSRSKLSAHYIRELRSRIREVQRTLGDATKDSDLPRNANDKLKAMEQTLAKGKQIQDDCAAVIKKLRAMLHSTEEQLRVNKKQAVFLTQLAAKTLPKGLHCLPLRLSTEYFSLDSSQQQFPNQEKLEDPKLYHYALFSDNVLAAAVVVNSTVSNAKHPSNHVFHIVTDRLNYAAMRMWFLSNPPGKSAIQVQNIEEFTWLNASYSPVLKQLGSQSMIDYYFRTHRANSDPNLKFRNPKYLSILNHLRFYLPEIFPKLNKVVFLDDDIVVQKDLSGLWTIDLKGKVNGAVETCGESFHRFDRYLNFSNPLISKNFDPHACGWAYGMNVFDLAEWRKQNITEVYHSWQRLNHDRLLWKLGTLPPGLITFWNCTFPLNRSWHVLGLGYNPHVAPKEIERAAVIHYNGNMKPWLEIGMPKYRNYWSKYVNYDQVFLRECNINP